MVKAGFGLVEAIVALVVFAVGALGAAALTAHAARMAGRAERSEAALLRMEALLDSLAQAESARSGSRGERVGFYEWRVEADSIGRLVEIRAYPGTDTLLLRARRPASPPLLPW